MTDEVRIRAMTEDDFEVLYENQLDPVATEMAGFPARDRDTFMAHRAKIMGVDTNELRTVLVGDEVAGDMNSWLQDGERLVGYWIGRKFWGRGVATAGLRLFVAELPDRPLVAHVLRTNVGSVRVLEKAGFVRRGVAESVPEEDVFVFE